MDHGLLATPHSFSQLITSFLASESLGILHALLFTSILGALLHLSIETQSMRLVTYVLDNYLSTLLSIMSMNFLSVYSFLSIGNGSSL